MKETYLFLNATAFYGKVSVPKMCKSNWSEGKKRRGKRRKKKKEKEEKKKKKKRRTQYTTVLLFQYIAFMSQDLLGVFFYESNAEFVSDMNAIPGCTAISLSSAHCSHATLNCHHFPNTALNCTLGQGCNRHCHPHKERFFL